VQGFAFAGEYSGAVLMLLEHAPAKKRGLYAGINNIGPVFGFVLSSGLLLTMNSLLSPAEFYSWGWRVPFVASLLLLAIGLYVRSRVAESPVFESAAKSRTRSTLPDKAPVARLFSQYPRELLLVSGAVICHFATFYLFTVFSLSYGQKELGLSNTLVLIVVMLAICTHMVAVPYSAALSDRIGRKPAMLIGLTIIALSAFPFWYLFSSGNFPLMVLGSCMLMVGYGMVYGPAPSFTGEAFGPSARFTGFAVATNIGGIIGGGTAPIVGTYLLQKFHSPYPIAVYIIATAVISAICVALSKETRSSDILRDR
jgi:MFS family permease